MLMHSEPIKPALCTAPKSIWNDIRLPTRLVELWKNHSAKQIAYILADEFQIGITRNMVISKIRRLGLSVKNKTELSPKTKYGLRTNIPARPKLRIVRSSVNPSTYKVFQSAVTDMTPLRVIPLAPLNLTLADLPSNGCRYIAGDDLLFCGHPRSAGSSFCIGHHQIVWVPPTARNQAMRGQRR